MFSGKHLTHLAVALALLSSARATAPNGPSLRALAGQLESELRANPQSPELTLSLAAVYLKLGSPERALPFARKAAEMKRGDSIATLTLADTWLECGRSDQALPLFSELASQMVSAEVWYGLAKSSLDLSRQAAARLQTDPAAAKLWNALQKRSPVEGGDPLTALRGPERAELLSPSHTPELEYQRAAAFQDIGYAAIQRVLGPPPASARRLSLVAGVFLWLSQYPEAIDVLQKAVALEPANGELWAMLGKAQWRNVDFTGAETSLRKAFDLRWADAESTFSMGDILSRTGRSTESIAYLQDSLSADPRPQVHAALARSFMEMSDFRGAVRELTAIPRAERTDSVWYQLYRAYSKNGQSADAQAALSEFRRLKDEKNSSHPASLSEKERQ
jgi:tetratricopeptide (TPR) repeat protein